MKFYYSFHPKEEQYQALQNAGAQQYCVNYQQLTELE